MAVRVAIEYHIVALPRTPFCHYVAFHPQGSVSLDSRVASLPYESSSLATSRGNKKFEEKNRESYTSCTTPAFPLWWLAPPPCPVGSMSLDSRVAGLPYESSSFATSRGNERYEEKNRGVICFMYYSSISPFGGWRHHLSAPLGSVSLDSQSPTAPCESCDTLSRGCTANMI